MKKFLLIFTILISLNIYPSDNFHVGVFCSADNKIDQRFKTIAFDLGKKLAEHQCILVTGGSKTGLMKEIMDGYYDINGNLQAYGIMPIALKQYNVVHPAIPETNILWSNTIHQRLQLFHDYCDVIIVLPGGFGTLHELLDFLVHQQFGLICKKIILFNYNNFWTPFLQQLSHMQEEQTITKNHLNLLRVVTNFDELMNNLVSDNYAQNNGLEEYYWEDNNN